MKLSHTTKRLHLRPLEAKDYEAWKLAHSTILPAKNIWDGKNKEKHELTKKQFNGILRDQKARRAREEFFDFAIIRKDTKEIIGFVGIMNVVRSVTQSAFLGYRLFNPHWGQGFAEEAVRGSFNIAFKELKLHRLVAGIEPKNIRSHKLAKKLGMRKEGLSKRVVYLREEWQDLVQYAIDCEELGIPWKGSTQPRKS
jgi:ribosomal-protein-alanine N-acetyltransferase